MKTPYHTKAHRSYRYREEKYRQEPNPAEHLDTREVSPLLRAAYCVYALTAHRDNRDAVLPHPGHYRISPSILYLTKIHLSAPSTADFLSDLQSLSPPQTFSLRLYPFATENPPSRLYSHRQR